MGSRRITGGRFDFVDDPDEEEDKLLTKKFGRHAKIGSKFKKEKKPNKPEPVPYEGYGDEFKLQREKERKEFFAKIDKPSLWQKLKRMFK